MDRFTVRWTGALLGDDVQTYRLAKVFTSAVTMTLITVISIALYTGLFGFARSIVLPVIYRLPIIPRLLRPFTAHFLRGPLSLTLLLRNWSLVRRAFVLGFITVTSWEFAEVVFDSYVAEVSASCVY